MKNINDTSTNKRIKNVLKDIISNEKKMIEKTKIEELSEIDLNIHKKRETIVTNFNEKKFDDYKKMSEN